MLRRAGTLGPPRLMIALIAVISVIALAAACGETSSAGAGEAGTATTATATATTPSGPPLSVFFVDEQGRLVRELRPGPPGLERALRALVAGPTEPGLVSALPAGTRVRSARVGPEGVAVVDLNAAFADGYPGGGAAAELAVLAPIVYTATAQPGVEAVRITVEGEPPDLLGTQLDLRRPLRRADVGASSTP